jgi:plastocyanin
MIRGLPLVRTTLRGTALSLLAVLACIPASAQTLTVSASVEVADAHSHRKAPDNGNVVVWLTPLTPGPAPISTRRFTLLQKNKTFEPHVLVIPVGSEVDFPNRDPFFHNVFSLFEGKRFDLGLYEAGSSRSLRFDRPGISYLFCNIHSEMSAVIIALEAPYYATSDRSGAISIPDVPAGQYMLHVWREGSSAETLKKLSRTVTVSRDSTSLGRLVLPNNAPLPLTHKNKYGKDYDNPTPGQPYEEK